MTTTYYDFNQYEDVIEPELTYSERAQTHASIAEELLSSVNGGVYLNGIPNHSAALVHAQLATAWTAIAAEIRASKEP